MSLTIKQARRMVAKSRRRVWRLARHLRPTVMIIAGDNGLAGYYAETWIPATCRKWGYYPEMPEAQAVCSEYQRRLYALWDLETEVRDRAWRTNVYRAATLVSFIDGAPIIGLAGDFTIETIELSDPNRVCAICGGEMDWIDCDHCGGEGGRDNDALMEEDPLWYNGVEWERCEACNGNGGWWQCYQAPHRDDAR